jgi:hypothetical protein
VGKPVISAWSSGAFRLVVKRAEMTPECSHDVRNLPCAIKPTWNAGVCTIFGGS